MKQVIGQGDVQTVVAVEDGNLVTGTVQDCTPLVEHTKRLHREGHHGSSEMKLAAKFPVVLVEKYCNINGITFQEFLGNPHHCRVMLTDPSLKDFRVWGGAI